MATATAEQFTHSLAIISINIKAGMATCSEQTQMDTTHSDVSLVQTERRTDTSTDTALQLNPLVQFGVCFVVLLCYFAQLPLWPLTNDTFVYRYVMMQCMCSSCVIL